MLLKDDGSGKGPTLYQFKCLSDANDDGRNFERIFSFESG